MYGSVLTAVYEFISMHRKNAYSIKPFLVKDGKTHPVAVICPGGAYRRVCSYVEGAPFARELNRLGYHAVVVYYRVREKARYPAPQEDLIHAIRDLLNKQDKWKLDMGGYSVWGSSAGGHLVATFAADAPGWGQYNLPKPGAVILCYPVVTMGEKTHPESREYHLGPTPPAQLVYRTSAENLVTADYPPTFLWWGDADTTVDPDNSRMLRGALQRNGVPCVCIEYKGVDHGVGLGKGLACEGWLKKAVSFWELQRKQA